MLFIVYLSLSYLSFQIKIYPVFKVLTTFPLASSTLILSSLWSMVTIMASPSTMIGLILVISAPANIRNIYKEHQTSKHSLTINNDFVAFDYFLAFRNSFTNENIHVSHF